MILNIVKLTLFFIKIINQTFCDVDLTNIKHADVQILQREFPKIMNVSLKEHPYYMKSNNGVMVCPVPYSHVVDYAEVPYEGIEIIDRRLEDVVYNCVAEKKYSLAYIIILNAIESIGVTYIYQFCEFAIEMNKLGADISFYLDQFSENLSELVIIFNKEWISLEPYECILNVYKKHEHKYKNYEFNNVDDEYMSDLLSCKNLMTDKVYFLTEPAEILMNNMTIDNLIMTQTHNDTIIKDALPSHIPAFKNITGYKYQTLCTGCRKLSHSGNIVVIYIFLPCGHGWSCRYCSVVMKQCPVCHQPITDFTSLPPRCFLDGREARCISCRNQIKYVDPPSKHVMIPCGDGWYCSKCIDNNSCTLCDVPIKDSLRVKLQDNE
ncbi:uncharacterized protein LOC126894370 isoform X2 [Daktulosphaira vitifoliae]|uniref:uncharacterized protein LOC126894370 isoform X2 n=1 Tax=Daktulosphaira vitifoliae TaxID=58002 RepID=UPI0021AA8435|nr:uncharacterized protein LOC126894370 isoform X2 [Daktulosphaira vitifoliae]